MKLLDSIFFPLGHFENSILYFLRLNNIFPDPLLIKDLCSKHPDYPSLYAYSNILERFGVAGAAYRLTEEEVCSEVPPPFVVLTRELNHSGHDLFEIVVGISDAFLTVYNPAIDGNRKISKNKFNGIYKGIAFVIKHKREPKEYLHNVNSADSNWWNFQVSASYFAFFLLFFVSLLFVYQILLGKHIATVYTSIIGILSLFGLIISFILGSIDKASRNRIIQKFCNLGNRTNCKHVSNHSESTLGGFSLANLAAAYFSTSIVFNLFVLTGANVGLGHSLISVIALCVIPYSLYVQARVIKTYCALCVLILVVIASEALVWWLSDVFQGRLVLVDMILGIAVWCIVYVMFLLFFQRGSLQNIYSDRNSEKAASLLRFKNNQLVFRSFISQFQKVTSIDSKIVLSSGSSSDVLTVVSSPLCGPCSTMHKELDVLMSVKTSITVHLLFAVRENDVLARTVALHLLHLSKISDSSVLKSILVEWYSTQDYNDFRAKYPVVESSLIECEDELRSMALWCSSNKINQTPTRIFNDSVLPSIYNIEDLEYLIK